MAIKRIRPVQDTYVSLKERGNVGLDEILELGAESRILMEFMTEELRAVLRPLRGKNYKAILHIYSTRAENLPPVYDIEVLPVAVEWVEGVGQSGDINPFDKEGVVWEDETLTYKGHKHKGKTHKWAGGTYFTFYKETPYTRYQLNRDIDIDVTEYVEMWVKDYLPNNGLIIKFKDESVAEASDTTIYYYSNETHTIFWPRLDIIWDDSIQEGRPNEVKGQYNIVPKNLQKEYSVGEKCRIDLDARPLYPKRTFSTSSLYEGRYTCPDGVLWGVKDEYTGETIVDFDPVGTRVSRDEEGSFFILDTDLLLEPERNYRLVFEDERRDYRKIHNIRSTFRVIRNGETG